jgi:hypothetical protein
MKRGKTAEVVEKKSFGSVLDRVKKFEKTPEQQQKKPKQQEEPEVIDVSISECISYVLEQCRAVLLILERSAIQKYNTLLQEEIEIREAAEAAIAQAEEEAALSAGTLSVGEKKKSFYNKQKKVRPVPQKRHPSIARGMKIGGIDISLRAQLSEAVERLQASRQLLLTVAKEAALKEDSADVVALLMFVDI